jgi:hypothetical protein
MWSFRDQDPSQFDLVDARYVVTPDTLQVPDFYELVQHSGRYALYRVPTTGAAEYVAITTRVPVASQLALYAANLAWWQSAKATAGQFVRWDYPSGTGPPDPSGGCPGSGRTLFEAGTADSIHVVVECPAASALMLKVSYHPGWTVTVDGVPVETYMVSPSYLAIDLPAGKHDVLAVYEGAPIKTPLALVGLTGLLAVVLFRRRLDWLPTRLGRVRIPRRAAVPRPPPSVDAGPHPGA